jgi:hypothetical protein
MEFYIKIDCNKEDNGLSDIDNEKFRLNVDKIIKGCKTLIENLYKTEED